MYKKLIETKNKLNKSFQTNKLPPLPVGESIEQKNKFIRASAVWRGCGFQQVHFPADVADIFSWLRAAVRQFGVIIPIAMWFIWCSRNRLVFDGKITPTSSVQAQILSMLEVVNKRHLRSILTMGMHVCQGRCPGRAWERRS